MGACVGLRGARVKNIVRELNNEKVDIIRWSDSLETLIQNGLKPAVINIDNIYPDVDLHSATVLVDEDQQSLAIGKKGQNVRLASRLCGWDIEIKTRAEFEADQMATTGDAGGEFDEDVDPALEAPLDGEIEATDEVVEQAAPLDEESQSEPPGGDSEASRVL